MSEPMTDAASAPPKVTTAQLSYHGTGASLFGLMLLSGLLSIVTLGIYQFWAKTRIRAFHYSHTELDGDRFAYHGTGGELWSGAIKATGILLLLAFSLGVASTLLGGPNGNPMVAILLPLGFYAAIGLLIPIAINGARRYRLSRSSWRGIRFSYHGRWQEYLGLSVSGGLLTVISLGFYLPMFQNKRQEYFVNHARFGSEPFQYRGSGRELFGEYLKALLLTIPTLGLSWVWYAAFKHRYFWSNTMMRGARFRSTVTGSDLLLLSLSNIAITLFTLGIGIPWVMTRTHGFYCSKLSMRGTVDWATIEQRAQQAGSAAEGLADAFDVDIGIA